MQLKEDIEILLKTLRLSSLRGHYENIALQSVQESLSYEQFLYELLKREHDHRLNSRIEKYLRESCLPLEKDLKSFEMKRLPDKIVKLANLLQEGFFLEKKENILAFGNPGSGKTHLLCAIGQELIFKGKRIYFIPCYKLVQNLLISKKELMLSKYIKKLSKYDAIIVDEFGYTQQTREEMEVLFTFLAERYERGSIMITSNLPFSQWEKIFKDPMVTAAAIDRLVHHSVIIELNLNSFRMESAKIKQSQTKKGGIKKTNHEVNRKK